VTTEGGLQAESPFTSVSGSGASYTVTVNGIRGQGTLRLDLIGNGTISDGSGNTLGSQSSFQGQTYTMSQVYPRLVSINRTTPASQLSGPGDIKFTITFNEPIDSSSFGTYDLQLALTGSVVASITQLTPVSGAVYTATVHITSGLGTIGLNFFQLPDRLPIHDVAGNPMLPANFTLNIAGSSAVNVSPNIGDVATADVNGDGVPELEYTTFGMIGGTGSLVSGVGVASRLGSNTFEGGPMSSTSNKVPPPAPTAVTAADVNGDGKPDLIATNSDDTVAVLLGNGDTTFQKPVLLATGKNPVAVAAADLNHDGKADLIIVNNGDNTVSVYLGNGDGTFHNPVAYAVGNSPSGLAVADLKGDGTEDIIVTTSGGMNVLLGNGDGSFQPAVAYTSTGAGGQPFVTDVNRDGIPDIVVNNSVLLGNGDGTFKNPVTFAVHGAGTLFAVADVNGDGIPDLLLTSSTPLLDGSGTTQLTLSVLFGNGDGTFGNQSDYNYGVSGGQGSTETLASFRAAVGLNRDGVIDFVEVQTVIGGTQNDASTIVVVFNESVGSFTFTGPTYTLGSLVDRYVAQLYVDLLQRPPDDAGLASFSAALDSGSTTPLQLATALVNSQEYRTLEILLAYTQILDVGTPDPDGVAHWLDYLNSGHTLVQLQAQFFASDQFFIDIGNSDNSTYVTRIYERLPTGGTDSEQTHWVQELNSGTPRATVTAAILGSQDEETADVDFLLYEKYLRREASASEVQNDVNALMQGTTYEQLVETFVSSPEYQQYVGSDLNQAYVAQLYQNLLGRAADSGGLASFTALLDSGSATRQQVVQTFLTSAEYRTDVVNGLYQKYLHRAPDPTELQNGVTALSQGQTDEQVAAPLLTSSEFFSDNGGSNSSFVQALYQDALQRSPSSSEQAQWVNAMQNGMSRLAVAQAFLGSAEYHRVLVTAYFQQFLHRPADSNGLSSLAGLLDSGQTDESLITLFVTSPEYYGRL
jgi:hypothetical protein